MEQITKDKLRINFENAHKMASNWVMSAAGTLGTIWFALPERQQQTVIEHLPIPLWMLPVVMTIIGVGARLWPQAAITPRVAAASSETAPQPLAEPPK